MSYISSGARRLPTHHITIRVPWHDSGWTGSVCANPMENTSCLVLPRIGESKNDENEVDCAGIQLNELDADKLPPCLSERVSFMAPFEVRRNITHPYVQYYPETHGHFRPTPFVYPAYSASCVPFRWTLRSMVEGNEREGDPGLAEKLKLGWEPEREPDIRNRSGKEVETAWVQEKENQLALLDTFFSALRPEESLCFFYAKRTPLSEQARRVIIGVGKVLSVSGATEHKYDCDAPPLECVLWERNVGHSIRPGFSDGFIFPYQEILKLADQEVLNPEQYVAFAPDEHFAAYSYGADLLNHDGAVASLISCAAVLHRISEKIEGPWDQVLAWVDSQLNRLWKSRGAFPGLGSALSAFGFEWGFQHGSLLAYEIEILRAREENKSPWELANEIMEEPGKLNSPIAKLITPGLRKGWKSLRPERRALLELISRCAISEDQALCMYDTTERSNAGIDVKDSELLENPYQFFETYRRSIDPIAFGSVDRGLFPDATVREKSPIPEPSLVEDPADPRRVRALVIDILEEAAREGHTLLPRNWVIQRARDRSLQPPCPLGESVLDTTEEVFGSIIEQVKTGMGDPAYQVDRLVECRTIIRKEVLGRKKGRQHKANYDWRKLVDDGLDQPMPTEKAEKDLEEQARQEKSAALEQLFRSRISVLIGPAGTGKTTLLRMLCDLEEVSSNGLLLLAPTGKARVRLEEQTGLRGSGLTIAQFLNRHRRYDGATGAYFPNRKAKRCGDYRTVIIDECSMLTEEQLAALIDSLSNVERLVLVGDPRQLPPIGAGRPFVDIVQELAPEDAEDIFPRCAPGYGELIVVRRQKGTKLKDMLLATHFSGRPLEPGVDVVWDQTKSEEGSRLRLVQWNHSQELHERLLDELVRALNLEGPDDELGFEISLGGEPYEDASRAFFWSKYKDRPGAASMAADWQILSPIRAGLVGVDALNRMIQDRFRSQVRDIANSTGWGRRVPRPVGPQTLLYGDKVINVINQRRRDVFPKSDAEAYIANGDIGIIVGQYKTRNMRGLPWKIEVEFAGQLGFKYGFYPGEFGDEGSNPLELAYCLTIHKTQGSEFSTTFVILPNPCWLLTRELLYTALTRHEDRLIILHQGSLSDYRVFSGDEHSEIAKRMTNLFKAPRPREVMIGSHSRFLEEGLIHRTERGDLVRSKSEIVIADKLYNKNIEYTYEQPLILPGGQIRYPDFTIVDHARGINFYWEHLGMLDNPSYKSRWEKKRAEYIDAGILPWKEGEGELGVLIETRDKPGGALDSEEIARLVEQVFR